MTTAPATPQETNRAHALLFIAPALWAVNYLAAKWAPGVIAPHALALGRWIVAASILTFLARDELRSKRHLIRGEMGRHVVLGALGMWVCGAFVYIGGHYTTGMNIGLLYAASPVLVVLASALWLHERLGARMGLGIVLALSGVLFIILKGDWGKLLTLQFNRGDLWIAVCVVCWAVYSVLLRQWPSAFGAIARTSLIAWGGVLVLVPFTLIEAASGVFTTDWGNWKGYALILATALAPGAGAYTAFLYMQRVLGASRAAMVLYLGPPYSAVVAYLVLGETIEWYHVLGAALILPGIWLTSRK